MEKLKVDNEVLPVLKSAPDETQAQAEYGLSLVDIGGTKERFLVVGVDGEGNILRDVVIAQKEVATPVRNLPAGDRDYFYDRSAEGVRAVQEMAGARGVKVLPLVCVGTPGRLVDGKIAPGTAGNLGKSFDGISPEEELSKRLNQDVRAVNDAIAQMGAGLNTLLGIAGIGDKLKGHRVCYIGPGTGLGGGFGRVNDDFSLDYFTDGHIFDILMPQYTGDIGIDFDFLQDYRWNKKIPEQHRLVIQSRFAEDVLSGRAVRQIACAMDRHLMNHRKEPLFLSLVDGYEEMSTDDKTAALEHDNNESPVNAKLINQMLEKTETYKKKERALPAANMIATFQGQMLGRMIECIYKGDIKKSEDDAQWPQQDVEKVKGTTNYVIGGSVGTKGEMGKVVRNTAIEYLSEKFDGIEFNLYAVKETENAGALGTAAFLKGDDITDAIKRLE